MSSDHSSDNLPEPTSPAPDLIEGTVFVSINDMLRAVSKEQEFVLELPRTTQGSFGRPPAEILITDDHSFCPLPAPDFMTLHMRGTTCGHMVMHRFGAQAVSRIRISLLRSLEGERGPAWRPTTFLGSTTHIFGCIMTTDTNQRLTCEQVLRSELLTLLSQLGFLIIQLNGKSSITESIFLLSFTHTEVRCLEAHIEAPSKVVVSVRQVLEQYPTGPKRDGTFKTLLTWAMVTFSNYIDLCAVPGVPSVSADDDDTDTDNDGDESSNS
ncbi:hypothetical protein F4679DRAFT_592926 [Xylaria curta]|nr:hypothetical protein F4679DRAFT_592926 [Xylaria curta]